MFLLTIIVKNLYMSFMLYEIHWKYIGTLYFTEVVVLVANFRTE